MNTNLIHLFALLLLIIGVAIGAWAKKRRFDRRNEAGIEQYDSFYSAELNGCMNTGLSYASKIIIIAVIVLFIYWKWKH